MAHTQASPQAPTKSAPTAPRKAGFEQNSVNTQKPAETHSAETPRLPHEHDESVGSTDGTPSKHMQQGYRDLQRGLKDTSRAPEAEAVYRKLKAGT